MKALLINPVEKVIEAIDVKDMNEIIKLIGYESVIADEVGEHGDNLYFDEECFLRGSEGRFQIDSLIPVSGIGVITGSSENGEIADMQTSQSELQARIKFL